MSSRHVHPVAGGIGIGLIVCAWALWNQAPVAPCNTMNCLFEGSGPVFIGLPLALAASWIVLWSAGAASPIGLVLLLVLITVGALTLLHEVDPPLFVWPFALGSMTTILLSLQGRANDEAARSS